MTGPGIWTGLLGQAESEEFYKAVRDTLNRGPSWNDELAMTIYGVIAIGFIAWGIRSIFMRNKGADELPIDTLGRALRELAFSGQERSDLVELARRAKLTYPLAMLLSPANFEHAVERGANTAADAALRKRLGEFASDFFDETPSGGGDETRLGSPAGASGGATAVPVEPRGH